MGLTASPGTAVLPMCSIRSRPLPAPHEHLGSRQELLRGTLTTKHVQLSRIRTGPAGPRASAARGYLSI